MGTKCAAGGCIFARSKACCSELAAGVPVVRQGWIHDDGRLRPRPCCIQFSGANEASRREGRRCGNTPNGRGSTNAQARRRRRRRQPGRRARSSDFASQSGRRRDDDGEPGAARRDPRAALARASGATHRSTLLRGGVLVVGTVRRGRGAERRRDGADLDPEQIGDRAVVEVGVARGKTSSAAACARMLGRIRERSGSSTTTRIPRSSVAWPFEEGAATSSSAAVGRPRRRWPASLTTIRQSQASSGPLSRNDPRFLTAMAKAAWTASPPASGSPAIPVATRTKCSCRDR